LPNRPPDPPTANLLLPSPARFLRAFHLARQKQLFRVAVGKIQMA
jgi:hypothetical protein